MSGGPGVDAVSYAGRPAQVSVRLDNLATDGVVGEHDDVRTDVENVTATSFADYVVGSAAANRLSGGPGNDKVVGGLGADRLDGSTGNDTLYSRDGVRDAVVGGTGTDRARVDAVDSRSSVESIF